MGIEYIENTKNSFKKGWNLAKQRLSVNDLFTISPEKIKTIGFKPSKDLQICDKDLYILRENAGKIFVYTDNILIGSCEEPPLSVLQDIKKTGIGLGKFYQKQEISGVIEIAVCFETVKDKKSENEN